MCRDGGNIVCRNDGRSCTELVITSRASNWCTSCVTRLLLSRTHTYTPDKQSEMYVSTFYTGH